MNFILQEIKLWFNESKSQSKSYEFLPNKVNVITGDATTGKTSFWSIIDYCFLSNKVNIANKIVEKVSWFGIRFTINGKEISIARRTPTIGAVSSEVFYSLGSLPDSPNSNIQIAELKAELDKEFSITESLRFPLGKEFGKSPFNLTFRYFLMFSALTEDIIGQSKTYFDTTFFGKDEYDKALNHIFNMVIGVNDMENIKSLERIKKIGDDISNILKQKSTNAHAEKKFENNIYYLINKLKENQLLEYSYSPTNLTEAISVIDDIIISTKKSVDNSKVLAEINELNKTRANLEAQIHAIERYRKEYEAYKKNLKKSADSLKPIEFLKSNLSDQLVDSYETKVFIDTLEESLREIQNALSKKAEEPIKVSGDNKQLQADLQAVKNRINQLNLIIKNNPTEADKLMVLGEVKNAKESFLEVKNRAIKPINNEKITLLSEEKRRLEAELKNTEQVKFTMKTALNQSIQRNFDLIESMAEYKNSAMQFDDVQMTLRLKPQNQLFPLDNIGSKSNYMLMHLCFYLGLHEHMINVGQEHVPRFLFIDQPSIPYYSGGDNNDKTKLLDAFSLMNSFIDHIVTINKKSFQVFMVEHAPESYWIDNDLKNFHTVAQFINGNGLIPSEFYKA